MIVGYPFDAIFSIGGTSANDDTILSKVNLNEFLLVHWYRTEIQYAESLIPMFPQKMRG
jgi:hypothetical protein